MHSTDPPFDALLLAAGFGTRLQPITQVIPKCLCPIGGKPLLGRWIETVIQAGVGEVFVNAHAHAPLVAHYLKTSQWWRRITWQYEKTILGTGGTLTQTLNQLLSRQKIPCRPLLVVHVDNYTDLNIKKFLTAHINRPNRSFPATLSLFKTDNPAGCGMVETHQQGTLTRFIEKPDPTKITLNTQLANAAVYFFEPDLIQEITSKYVIGDISNDLLPRLIHRAHTFYHRGFHIDIGNLKTYASTLTQPM